MVQGISHEQTGSENNCLKLKFKEKGFTTNVERDIFNTINHCNSRLKVQHSCLLCITSLTSYLHKKCPLFISNEPSFIKRDVLLSLYFYQIYFKLHFSQGNNEPTSSVTVYGLLNRRL